MKKRGIDRDAPLASSLLAFLLLLVFSWSSFFSPAFAGSKAASPTREEAQKALFTFVSKVYQWSGYFYLLRKDESQDIKQVYFHIKAEKAEKFYQLLLDNRQVLLDFSRFNDLYLLENIEVIPYEIYDFIRTRFGISSLQEPIERDLAILKLVGGHFDYDKDKSSIEGFYDVITKLNLNKWQPVKKFIDNFESSVNRDLRLAQLVGKTLLPLVRHYFGYLDVISRLRIFNEVVDDALFLGIDGEDLENDIDKVAIKVFQTTGPVMMKLLQQLQDETKGETAMTRVLKGIENCKPMDEKKAYNLTKEELAAMSGNADLSDKHYGFKFRPKPLGIASIAQTHLIAYRGQDFVVKIQKDRVADMFAREATALERLVTSEEEFDKGMKQKIANIHAGIVDELDFNFERNNIENGYSAYNDPANKVLAIEIPAELKRGKKGALYGSSQVLIMTKAEGEPLGKLMERADKAELTMAYEAIQRLYEKFLDTALNPQNQLNFYHGDLHRGNIFVDRKTQNLTLIDFGNAGILSRDVRKGILEIYDFTGKTYTLLEKQLDQAILYLAKVMQEFVFKFNQERINRSKFTGSLIKAYFASCFNPNLTPRERIQGGRALGSKIEELRELKRVVSARLAKNDKLVVAADLEVVQDDIDFVKALQNNCFSGPTNPLLIALANQKMLVSDKLNTVFQELQKNGITMPKEVIFFNKSKALLEGILTNIDNSMSSQAATYTYVDPDEIYKRVLAKLGEQPSSQDSVSEQSSAVEPSSSIEQSSAEQRGTPLVDQKPPKDPKPVKRGDSPVPPSGASKPQSSEISAPPLSSSSSEKVKTLTAPSKKSKNV